MRGWLVGMLTSLAAAGIQYSAQAHDLVGVGSQTNLETALPPKVVEQLRQNERLRASGAAGDALVKALKADETRPKPQAGPDAPPDKSPTQFELTIEGVMSARARWPQGTLIAVCFLDGSASARQRFMQVMAEEIALTNLKLRTGIAGCPNPGAQIRVSFNGSGNYSYVGTEAMLIPAGSPTLNLQSLGGNGQWTAAQTGVARHEVGHALALLHEHQHPSVDCKFKSEAELSALMGWSLEDVRTNFARLRAGGDIVTTGYDRKSIMHYQLPASYFQDPNSPCLLASRNNVLSPGDVTILRSYYPK